MTRRGVDSAPVPICRSTARAQSPTAMTHQTPASLLARAAVACLCATGVLHAAEPKVSTARSRSEDFSFRDVPPPALNDAGSKAKVSVVAGTLDRNGAGVEALTDGKVPTQADEPRRNVFFAPGEAGGRLVFDLGEAKSVTAIASFSWHPESRAAQRYTVWGSASADAAGATEPTPEALAKAGWTLVGKVDTSRQRPGQHAARLSAAADKEPLGNFRHLLFDVSPNPDPRGFGQTFYGEIDIETSADTALERLKPAPKQLTEFEAEDKAFKIVLDSTASPDLLPWFKDTAVPVLMKWYPKVRELICLPGQTPDAPKVFEIELREGQLMGRDGIPAYASGPRMTVSSKFMRDHMKGEAVGCLIHEMVHVVQFGNGKRAHRSAPSWLLEGATDYIRWFLFEPESNGAVIRNPDRVHHDDSYRTTANFIDWVTRTHTKDLVQKIHIALHQGYKTEDWKTWTGKPVEELETEWKAALRK